MSSKSRSGLLGIVLGIIFALAGAFSGIYFGVIQPLQENDSADQVPMSLIVISVTLLGALMAYLGHVFVTHGRKRKNRPPEW